jgi:hypothetical protein
MDREKEREREREIEKNLEKNTWKFIPVAWEFKCTIGRQLRIC